jgi:endonuclease/exonuclease/phosphatase family metal-dependent hydrolase
MNVTVCGASPKNSSAAVPCRSILLARALALLCTVAVSLPLVGCRGKGPSDDHRTTGVNGSADTVVCLCYNVENLFDLVDDGTEYPEYRPGQCNWGHETFTRKLENISSVIAAAAADIVVLCEIENLRALSQLRRSLSRKRKSYKYYAIGDRPNRTATCTAVLSRLPIVGQRSHAIPKLGESFTRNLLEADVKMGACTLKVFAVHWPSKRNPESHRVAAAEVLRKRLEELPPGTDYVLAGDFNADLNECEAFEGRKLDDTQGRTGLNHVLRTVSSAPGERPDYIDETELVKASDGSCHYDLWFELRAPYRFSYVHRKKRLTLDHILLPAALYDGRGAEYVDNSFDVFRWNGRLLYDGKPYRWRMQWTRRGKRHVGEGYSDHLPLLVKLTVAVRTARD